MMTTFTPVIVVMDFDSDGKAALRCLGAMERVTRACGIRFPEKRADASNMFKSFSALRDSLYVQSRPLVFFPECTRSNGKGVLQMPKEAVSFISAALYQDGFKVHALRFDYPQSSASMQPYNSVDVSGMKHAVVMIGQFLNKIVVQYLFNLEN